MVKVNDPVPVTRKSPQKFRLIVGEDTGAMQFVGDFFVLANPFAKRCLPMPNKASRALRRQDSAARMFLESTEKSARVAKGRDRISLTILPIHSSLSARILLVAVDGVKLKS